MATAFNDPAVGEIHDLLADYFDGLYEGDLQKFERVFHEAAHLYSTDGETITVLPRTSYFDRIANRQSHRSQKLKRFDRIVSVHISGPNTAQAVVNCAIPPRYFTDYLTLLRSSNGWQIISKTFHTDVHQ